VRSEEATPLAQCGVGVWCSAGVRAHPRPQRSACQEKSRNFHLRFHGMQYREQEGTTNLRVKEEADFSVVLFRSNFMLFSEKNHIKVRRTQWLLAMPYPPICFTATDSARCSYRTPSGGTVNTFP